MRTPYDRGGHNLYVISYVPSADMPNDKRLDAVYGDSGEDAVEVLRRWVAVHRVDNVLFIEERKEAAPCV